MDLTEFKCRLEIAITEDGMLSVDSDGTGQALVVAYAVEAIKNPAFRGLIEAAIELASNEEFAKQVNDSIPDKVED